MVRFINRTTWVTTIGDTGFHRAIFVASMALIVAKVTIFRAVYRRGMGHNIVPIRENENIDFYPFRRRWAITNDDKLWHCLAILRCHGLLTMVVPCNNSFQRDNTSVRHRQWSVPF